MRKQRKSPKAHDPTSEDLVSAPYNHLYGPRNPDEDRLVTTLMLAGEALAAPLQTEDTEPRTKHPTPHATSLENARPAILDDFEWLLEIVKLIQARLAEDSRRMELLARLTEAFGDGETLKLLFRNLFPGQKTIPSRDNSGKSVLTPTEVEVLREAAKDLSREEIAKNLSIAPRTVGTHLHHIYKKLSVQRPLQAVTRAISMGYLEMTAIDFIQAAANCNPRNFCAFDTTISRAALLEETLALQPLAEFGLLMMTLSGMSGSETYEDGVDLPPMPRGVVCELCADGTVVHSFGSEILRQPRSIAFAPPQAARHGFTPGHPFVIHDLNRRQGVNNSAVAEFTRDGSFLRIFCGGRDLGTRLHGGTALAFAADGRMLVGTDGTILAFSDGGAVVQRFADGSCHALCISASGQVYMVQHSSIGSIIKVFDAGGQLLRTIGGTSAGSYYIGIAVSSHNHVCVSHFAASTDRSGALEVYDANGNLLYEFKVPGLGSLPNNYHGDLLIDAQDHLYVSCPRTRDIKVLLLDGTMIRRIDLRGKVVPSGLAVEEDGRLWVCGYSDTERRIR